MNVHDEFTRRVAADRLCRELMRAIAENDTAALERLGMKGFGQYAGRLSELMTDSVRRELLGADDFGAIMDEVAKPAHYAHHLVNEGGSAIQQALDKRQGIRLRVIEPEFNDGRLKGIVGEASESDSENAADNLAVQLGTMVKDMGNVFLKQNAEQRSRAGFKVTVTRTGGAKCCPWCADRTGKWELANAPDGVFGCHDNCKCMVDYTNSKGTVRGRAVTHKIDGKTVTKWEFADKIPYTPPRVLTKEEAAARGGFDKPKRLTEAPKRGTMLPDIVIGRSLGAKAKNYDIMDLNTGEMFRLVEGSHLQNVEVFAGKGGYKPYNNAWKYARDFGGKVEDWQHVKGFGLVDYYGEAREAELHWSQCAGFGKHDFFIKRWLDEG